MTRYALVRGLAVAAVVLGAGLFATSTRIAADDEAEKKKQLAIDAARVPILKLTGAVAKGDKAEAQKAADEVKKHELEFIMAQLKLRQANGIGGLGLGEKPGSIAPDGIEAKLIELTRKPLGQRDLVAQAAEIEKAAYVMAAIAEVSVHLCPVKKKQDKQDPEKWKEWCEGMKKEALELAKAAKAKDPMAVKKVASDLRGQCTECHNAFRVGN